MMMAALAVVAFFSSCNKEDDIHLIPQKRLIEAHKYVFNDLNGDWEMVENSSNEYFEWDGDRLVKWHDYNYPNIVNDSFLYDEAGRVICVLALDSNNAVESYSTYDYDGDHVGKITFYNLDSVPEAEYVMLYDGDKLTDIEVPYFDATLFKSAKPVVRHDLMRRYAPEAFDNLAQQAKGMEFFYKVHYDWDEEGASTAYLSLLGITDTLRLTYGNMPNPYYGFYEYNYIDQVLVLMAFPMFSQTLPTTFSERGIMGNADGEFVYEFDGNLVTKCTYDTPETRRNSDGTETPYTKRTVTTFVYAER